MKNKKSVVEYWTLLAENDIEARYPDIKLSFYKKADKIFAEKYIKEIKGFYQWLKKKIQL